MKNDSFTDYILSSLKVKFPQISQNDDIIETKYPNTSNICVFSLTPCAIPEGMDHLKLQDKSTNNKDKNLTLKIIQEDYLIDIKTPHVQYFQCSPHFLSHPSMCLNFYQIEFTESKN